MLSEASTPTSFVPRITPMTPPLAASRMSAPVWAVPRIAPRKTSDTVLVSAAPTAPVPLMVFTRAPLTVLTAASTTSPVPRMLSMIPDFTVSTMCFCSGIGGSLLLIQDRDLDLDGELRNAHRAAHRSIQLSGPWSRVKKVLDPTSVNFSWSTRAFPLQPNSRTVRGRSSLLNVVKKLRGMWEVLYGAAVELMADNGFVLAASIAFFTIFSLAPLLLLVVAVTGLV